MTTERLLHGIVELFPDDTFPPEIIDITAGSLRNVTLDAFFWFHGYASSMARPQEVHRPDLSSLTSRATLHRRVQNQYRAHGSNKALAPMLPGDLDRDQHMQAAVKCVHPFSHPPEMELDACF
eukprot:6492077-Amphidinium_carterae.4